MNKKFNPKKRAEMVAALGEEMVKQIEEGALALTEELERSGTKFKSFSEKAESGIMELLQSLPEESITQNFLARLQMWIDSQAERLGEEKSKQIQKQIAKSGHESFFFRELGAQVNTRKKMTDPRSIWFNRG